MTQHLAPTGSTARRFPLVARHRPACTPLPQRVADLCARADTANRDNDMAGASAVFNLAALLASDCGLPDLARQWCHRQANVYLRAHPLGAQVARHALEPLVNLARLHSRAGQGDQALRLITNLYEAISTRSDTIIDGITVPAAGLTTTHDAHQDLCRWLWATMLATTARALAVSGRWHEAHAHLRRHKGIGQRMLDGRQVAVLDHITTGDLEAALELLHATEPGERWETAVTTCLTALCRGSTGDNNPSALFDCYHRLDRSAPGLTVFHIRLGLTILDAAGTADHPDARKLASDLISRATDSGDGYAARDLLSHDEERTLLTNRQRDHLSAIVTSCALGNFDIPAATHAELSAALDTSEATLTRAISRPPGQDSECSRSRHADRPRQRSDTARTVNDPPHRGVLPYPDGGLDTVNQAPSTGSSRWE